MGWGGPTSPPDVFPGGRLREVEQQQRGSMSTQSRSKVAEALPYGHHPPRFPRLPWHCSPDLDERSGGIPSHQHPSASSSSSTSICRSWAEPCLWLHFFWEHSRGFRGSGHPGSGAGTAGQWGWQHLTVGLAQPSAADGATAPLPTLVSFIWQQPGATCPLLLESAHPIAPPP